MSLTRSPRSGAVPLAAQPAPPSRLYSFTGWQASNPTAPPPGDRMDADYDNTNTALTQTLSWAATSLNTDGTLKAGSVGQSQMVSGLFDDIAQDIIAEVQPLVDQANGSAASAWAASTAAQASATAADRSNTAAGGAASTATTAANTATAAQSAAQGYATTASTAATNAHNSDNDAEGSAALAQDYADVTQAWAEHMPDTIPPNILAVMGITGDHWSSRWWANQAAVITTGAINYRGAWNPVTNTPILASGGLVAGVVSKKGDYYLVSVTGTSVPIDGQTTWTAGDWVVSNGTAWQRVQSPAGPWIPLTGATLQGPLYWTATGGTASRSAQDRSQEHVSALDFGIVCDGVTDQGAALNTALAAIAPGTTLFIPGSIYTTQTIVVANGCKLEMPVTTIGRPSGGPTLMAGGCAIIGSATLSPVVLVTGNAEGGLTDVWITRNGTPAAGSIGLQVLGQDHLFTRVRSYNHARGIQCGTPAALPIGGNNACITMQFDGCFIWNCTEDFLYLVNSPEMTFYNMRFGINGATDPIGAVNAMITIDGDNNTTTGAGTANTLNFIRCQFNSGCKPRSLVRFLRYSSPDGMTLFSHCYMAAGQSSAAAFYVDPSCTVVRDMHVINNIIDLGPVGTLLSDTGHSLLGLLIANNTIVGGNPQPAAGCLISGISAQIIGNKFNGPFTLQLDAMSGGACVGNSVNTLSFTGAFTTGTFAPFISAGNSFASVVQTATGTIQYVEPYGNYGSQLTLGGHNTQGGRVDFVRADGTKNNFVGIDGAGGTNLALVQGTGSPVVLIDARNSGGIVSLRTNAIERLSVTDTAVIAVQPLTIGASAGPTIRAGTGAASGTQPKGSMWMRTDGAVGTTMYVSQGAGTWNAVAGV